MRGVVPAEISGACFVGDDVVVSTSAEPNEPDGPDGLRPNMLPLVDDRAAVRVAPSTGRDRR